MTKLPTLPLTPEQAERAIDGLTGRIVAMSAIQRTLLAHITALAPAGIEALRTHLSLQAADSQEELQGSGQDANEMFVREIASATQLIDTLQAARDQQ